MSREEILNRICVAVAEGEEDEALDLVRKAFEMGLDPMVVLNEGAAKGMDIVSEQYSAGEAFLPELVLAGDAMGAVVKVIFENMSTEEAQLSRKGIVVIGQAKGDVHDIGKNIVAALLAVNGFEIHDLGTDVDVKTFFQKAEEFNADIVAVSTLLTTSLPYMADVLSYIRDTGNRKKYHFIIGGGPVTPQYAETIGADGWSRNAFDCVELCKQLMNRNTPGEGGVILIDSEVMAV